MKIYFVMPSLIRPLTSSKVLAFEKLQIYLRFYSLIRIIDFVEGTYARQKK